MSRIPRAIVEGKIRGPVSPASFALWVALIGIRANRHMPGWAVEIPIARHKAASAKKAAWLLHRRRDESFFEILSPVSGQIEQIPLVRRCKFVTRGTNRVLKPGELDFAHFVQVELDPRLTALIHNYDFGYAKVDAQALKKYSTLAVQRLYCLARLYAHRRHKFWRASVAELADVLGYRGRRNNFSNAVERACSEVAEASFPRSSFQWGPIYSGRKLCGFSFELVWGTLDISGIGTLPRYDKPAEVRVPPGWLQCIRRQIERVETPRRRSLPRSFTWRTNFAALKDLIDVHPDTRRELGTLSPGALSQEVFELASSRAAGNREYDEEERPPPTKAELAMWEEVAAERQRAWDEIVARGEDPDPLGSFIAECNWENEANAWVASLIPRVCDLDGDAYADLEAEGLLHLVPNDRLRACQDFWGIDQTS
jgi:hypothetical protein